MPMKFRMVARYHHAINRVKYVLVIKVLSRAGRSLATAPTAARMVARRREIDVVRSATRINLARTRNSNTYNSRAANSGFTVARLASAW